MIIVPFFFPQICTQTCVATLHCRLLQVLLVHRFIHLVIFFQILMSDDLQRYFWVWISQSKKYREHIDLLVLVLAYNLIPLIHKRSWLQTYWRCNLRWRKTSRRHSTSLLGVSSHAIDVHNPSVMVSATNSRHTQSTSNCQRISQRFPSQSDFTDVSLSDRPAKSLASGGWDRLKVVLCKTSGFRCRYRAGTHNCWFMLDLMHYALVG